MKSLSLKYGCRAVELGVPEAAQVVQPPEPAPVMTPKLFGRRVGEYLDSAGFDYTDVGIVVSDKTRRCGYPDYLPVLMEQIQQRGASPAAVKIYIAYGTHSPQTEEECREVYGDCYDTRRFVHHRCEEEGVFAELGVTDAGTPVLIRRDVLDSSLLITFGAISHHYFAGYGGGRKLLFPGLARKNAIYANHGLFLDRGRGRLHPGCQPGTLEGNPVAEDLAHVESRFRVDMAIHGILGSSLRVCDLLVGSGGPEHFRRACAVHASHAEVESGEGYDLVVASCGGSPKDINLIQAHKSIHHAASFVRDGGRLITFAECPDGVGSTTFLPWFECGGRQRAFERLAASYEGNGGTALAMMEKTERIRIGMVTELPPQVCHTIGVDRLTPQEATREARECQGSVGVIQKAGVVVRNRRH